MVVGLYSTSIRKNAWCGAIDIRLQDRIRIYTDECRRTLWSIRVFQGIARVCTLLEHWPLGRGLNFTSRFLLPSHVNISNRTFSFWINWFDAFMEIFFSGHTRRIRCKKVTSTWRDIKLSERSCLTPDYENRIPDIPSSAIRLRFLNKRRMLRRLSCSVPDIEKNEYWTFSNRE